MRHSIKYKKENKNW